MVEVPGWYVDAMEQNLGVLIANERVQGSSVEQLTTAFLDPSVDDAGQSLTPEEHLRSLALCVAICVRRLARVDMPT